MRITRNSLAVLLLTALAGCAGYPTVPAGTLCTTSNFSVSDDFAGARRGPCTPRSGSHVALEIRAEDNAVINESPWYAFRIDAVSPGDATVTLNYVGRPNQVHRYLPKISTDGKRWTVLPESRVRVGRDGLTARLHIPVGEGPLWVSAQELIMPRDYDEWIDRLVKAGSAERSVQGYSAEQRPIWRLDAGIENKDVLLVAGRQHPPEVSGAIALFPFAETLLGDSDLAERFRQRFHIVIVPLINPDGVVRGHWRHNTGETDLNRDWGPFEQPETRAMLALLDGLDASGATIRIFADFHSMSRNTFYTQSDDFPTAPAGFTQRWLAAAEARLQDYTFEDVAGAVSDQANSKNYMYKRYGTPAVTFEVGDETDRTATRAAAVIFAEELMQRLLTEIE